MSDDAGQAVSALESSGYVTVEMFRLLGGGVPGDLVELPQAQLGVLPGTSHVGMLDRVTGVLDDPGIPDAAAAALGRAAEASVWISSEPDPGHHA